MSLNLSHNHLIADATGDAVAVIGGGNMTRALVGGLIGQGIVPERFEIVEPDEAARNRLADDCGIIAKPVATSALSRCRTVLWAVKPQSFSAAYGPVSGFVSNALHISIMAGLQISALRARLGSDRIIRCVPNTPALIGKGITGMVAGSGASDGDKVVAEQLFSATGEVVWLNNEAELDMVTAVSGSGPAYVFYFLEAVIEAGVSLGLPSETARHLAVGTVVGAASLAQHSPLPIASLREQVTSKGGTTAAALSTLDSRNVRDAICDAVRSAHARAAQLSAL